MRNYIIKPLLLSKIMGDHGFMTYLTNYGQHIVRPYVMWYIRAGKKHILVDTSIEAEDYRNYHPGFNKWPFEAVQSFEEALAMVDCGPMNIDIVIQTHLHIDHVYNTTKCKNAMVYVQKDELHFALNPHPIFEILYPQEIINEPTPWA